MMATKIIILLITALFIAWGLCRNKQTDKQKIRKTDLWFLISSLIICITMTALHWAMHIRVNLWFLLLPTVSISLMCICTGRTKKHKQEKIFTLVEKVLLVLLVIFLCSGVVDCSLCEYGIRRLTHFSMASMFYKMLGGWILAELVLCRQFPHALSKAFFIIVFTVNVTRFILIFTPWDGWGIDGTYPLIQIIISLPVLCYMYYKEGFRLKVHIDKK